MALATVVLLGDVGMGKSTLIEKVTGVRGISSDANQSFTRSAGAFVSRCGRLQIIDTPGSNAMKDKLEHNVWIAYALNFAPVSSILLIVKADVRIDNTVNNVRTYAERFVDLLDLVCVCVTHMDVVSWSAQELEHDLRDELGIDFVIFSGKSTAGDGLLADILGHCRKPQDLKIDSDKFLKLFKINDSKLKIMKHVNEEVNAFRDISQQFSKLMHNGFNAKERVDLVFEFQAYMTNQITEAQKRVSELSGFTFMGDTSSIANEAGHIANLTAQLKAVLHDVRTLALGFTSSHGTSNLRKCPHCGLVWAKVSGCDGETTCGNIDGHLDVRSSDFSQLATFRFNWADRRLEINKLGFKTVSRVRSSRKGVGCGKRINWSQMAPVELPSEVGSAVGVSTDDVDVLHSEAKPPWEQTFEAAMAGKNMAVTKM